MDTHSAIDSLLEAASAEKAERSDENEHTDDTIRTLIEFDGLRLETDTDGFRLETPGFERSGLSERELREALDTCDPSVTNWQYWQDVGGDGTARRDFLRWCERAPIDGEVTSDETSPLAVPDRYEALDDGIEREWGQLLVTTERSDHGDRRYDLRHIEDRDTALERLETYAQPREARDLTTADESGRYRPLKTAPTLVSGWVFPELDGDELVETVGFIYPATVANWHRERRGNLDVDHWLETATRQTGIYDVVDELPKEAVEWMAEACCVDSQCLRRREWEYEEGGDLDVDGGDGVFPCREPCSLVIAAARKWAILETETERTWEFQLTTSEKHQLEALVEAVADGRIDEIREADVNDGANRYRARYLRAKRMDDEGNLDEAGSD